MLVAALLLEIDRRTHLGELHHVDRVASRATFGEQLCVERAVLRAQIGRLDLRKVLAERLDDRRTGGIAVVRVEQHLAFSLGLRHVGSGLDAVHLGDLARVGGAGHARRRRHDSGGERTFKNRTT